MIAAIAAACSTAASIDSGMIESHVVDVAGGARAVRLYRSDRLTLPRASAFGSAAARPVPARRSSPAAAGADRAHAH